MRKNKFGEDRLQDALELFRSFESALTTALMNDAPTDRELVIRITRFAGVVTDGMRGNRTIPRYEDEKLAEWVRRAGFENREECEKLTSYRNTQWVFDEYNKEEEA